MLLPTLGERGTVPYEDQAMKAKDIKIGGKYTAKVAGNITTVRVDTIRESFGYGGRSTTVYDVTNLRTGRKIVVRSPQRFRGPAGESPTQAAQRQAREDIDDQLKKAAANTVAHDRREDADEDRVPPPSREDLIDAGLPAGPPDTAPGNAYGVANGMGIAEPSRTSTPQSASPAPTVAPAPTAGFAHKLAASQGSTDAPHVQLKALAGTGKTTSCIEGLKHTKGIGASIQPSPQQAAFWQQLGLGKSDTIRLSAFNTTITDEMKSRVNAAGLDKRGCEARGVHSLGYAAVTRQLGRLEASDYTVPDLCAEVLGGNYHDLRKQTGVATLMKASAELVSLCKQNLVDPTPENLEQLAGHYDVEVNGQWARVVDLVPQVLDRCKSPKGRIAFDDMVWLPIVLGLPVPKVDVQIIDEAQDLNRMQQELIYRAGHRVVFVGDPHQAIYGFAGADSESMPRMARTLGATPRGIVELPLTVTRRCGKAIVEVAREYVPDFEAHESCPEGMVDETARYPIQGEGHDRKTLPWEQTYCRHVRDGAMILCRVNAPLVSECFRFIKRRIKANILGRKIGDGLVALIEKSKANTTDQLRGWMDDWLTKEMEAEDKKKYPSEARKTALQDKHDCVACFADECTYVSEVVQRIKEVFTDSKDVRGIRLASIHKSKGLEADQVFFLQPEGGECPHPSAKSNWQRQQEINLCYVACTRAIHELYIVC